MGRITIYRWRAKLLFEESNSRVESFSDALANEKPCPIRTLGS